MSHERIVDVADLLSDARKLSVIMHTDAKRTGCKNKNGAQGDSDAQSIQKHFVGIMCENGPRRYLELPLVTAAGYIPMGERDLKAPDISPDVEVRGVETLTHGARCRPDDEMLRRILCVYWDEQSRQVTIKGWQWAWIIRRHGTWINPNGKGTMAFTRELRDVDTLFDPQGMWPTPEDEEFTQELLRIVGSNLPGKVEETECRRLQWRYRTVGPDRSVAQKREPVSPLPPGVSWLPELLKKK